VSGGTEWGLPKVESKELKPTRGKVRRVTSPAVSTRKAQPNLMSCCGGDEKALKPWWMGWKRVVSLLQTRPGGLQRKTSLKKRRIISFGMKGKRKYGVQIPKVSVFTIGIVKRKRKLGEKSGARWKRKLSFS